MTHTPAALLRGSVSKEWVLVCFISISSAFSALCYLHKGPLVWGLNKTSLRVKATHSLLSFFWALFYQTDVCPFAALSQYLSLLAASLNS